ncbi:unnamed protein product [Mytilus coruscus]|uniref:TNFR-Cys domain-containing protein n=1 Tax=Mytilus coruscus TaxID=42192 RepID=A0A6J8BD21_MYTCO|nr:unnamed protein product [Mytilus coruscus]
MKEEVILFSLICLCWSQIHLVKSQTCNCATDCTTNCVAGEFWDNGACAACSQGYYCPGGSSTKTICTAGTYNPDPSKSASSDCLNCAAGEYSNAGATACISCPKGKYCPSAGTGTPTPCAAGTYSLGGEDSCTDCPIGSYCVATDEGPRACAAGEHTASSNQQSCSQCPAGHRCPNQGAAVACPAGFYSNAGDGACSACAPGTYIGSTGSSTCDTCPEGKKCENATSTPTDCDPGYVAAAGSSTCTLCANNEVASTTQAICEPCPAGKACTNPTTTPVDCNPGEYALQGDAACTTCPAGSYCATTTAAAVACPASQYSAAGAMSCTDCPAGYKCDTAASVPVKCALGDYSAAATMACSTCTAGKYCPDEAAAETDCPDGFYAPAGQAACTPCEPGKECSDKTQSTDCAAGTYSLGLQTSCTAADAGYEVLDKSTTPNPCDPGEYNLAGSSSNCTTCPGGSYCPVTTSNPIACSAGYLSSPGATECVQCPAGYECPDSADASQNKQCAAGWHSVAGDMACTPCTAGFYCFSVSSSVEIPCPDGQYSAINSTSCTVCEAGKICPNKDGVTTTQTDECPPGTYSLVKATSCTPCPAGKACPTTSQDVEVTCDPGTYSLDNQTVCTQCPIGKECPDVDTNSTIKDCESGYYSLGNQKECTLCDEGYYCPHTTKGQTICQPGFYSAAGSTNCTGCEAGYYCPEPEYSRRSECPPGTYSNGGATACSNCNEGYQCAMGSTSPSPADGLCPAGGWCDGKNFYRCEPGLYNQYNGSVDASACVACPPGYYCQGPGEVDYNNYPCPVGHYCLAGTTLSVQYPCPGGTYLDETNATSVSLCKPCPEAKYCQQGSTADGIDCPAGFYCVGNQASGFQNACPIGTYGPDIGYKNASECIACPAGFYCPAGTQSEPRTSPIPCEPGTYNPTEHTGHPLNCKACEKGFACPEINQTASTMPCKVGYFCPAGTIVDDQFPLSTRILYKHWARGWPDNPPEPCQPGFYCPLQTPSDSTYPCPSGTFSTASDLYDASQCTPCTQGYYCNGGESAVSGICPTGYYCPEGTRIATEFGCPNGTYNDGLGLYAESQCKNCTLGHYCEFAVYEPTECEAGTYMPYGADTSGNVLGTPAKRQFDCYDCPGGFNCPQGTGTTTPINCTVGWYSEPGQYICIVCQIGHYCDNATTSEEAMLTDKRCPAGSYCLAGLTTVSDATPCSVGKYCLEATVEETNCPVGTVRKTVGAAAVTDCAPCDAGYYCLEGSSTPTGQCEKGYYCPTDITNTYGSVPALIGSYGSRQAQCPEGTYTDVEGTPDLASCKPCSAGYYCPIASSIETICDRGYYCVANSSKPEPCPIGRYGNVSGLPSLESCPLCDPGQYCDAPGLLQPRAPCDPGYICILGATSSSPTDGVTGSLCPAGGYCVLGSYEAAPCPLGTYSNTSGAVNDYDCTDCDQGYYCSSVAGGAPTGQCWGGHFCNGSAKVPYQWETDPGHFAINGSTAQEECEIATYMPYHGYAECFECPPGAYCPNKAMTEFFICPAGKYCANGTYVPLDCPPGTFSDRENMTDIANCTDCPAGSFCQDRGSVNVTGPCKAGHICYGNALSDDPVYNNDTAGNKTIITYGDTCHPGYYCLAGTAVMTPCPRGTYNPDRGGTSEAAACLPCDPGTYCNDTALTDVSGDCDAGYYCTAGSWIPDPVNSTEGDICPLYHICPTGSDAPQQCAIGYYANNTGLSSCTLCIAGYMCYPGVAPQICPQGYYCPASTLAQQLRQPKACPVATYGNREGLEAETDCTTCDGGYYCETTALTNVTGPIQAGHFSQYGSGVSTPGDDPGVISGVCPKGHYCPQQSSLPTPCPAGTYGFSIKLQSEAACTNCDGGYYCPSQNMTDKGPQCTAGYYCSSKSPEPTPVNSTYGDICPAGSYCEIGSQGPTPCPAGYYTNQTGLSACYDCPKGHYCLVGTSSPEPCPMGYWCPINSELPYANPCPTGKYNNNTGQDQATDCTACPPGYYCETQGLAMPTGECDGGWYCIEGSEFAQPNVVAQGGECQAGNFCPNGSSSQTPCTPGYYCDNNGLSNETGLCSAGYYCNGGSSTPTPVGQAYGDVCQMGQYCPIGSPSGTNCPPGTYLNTTGSTDLSDCHTCLQGYYCAGYGNPAASGPCTVGFYCPTGMNISTPGEYTCPQGHYCPEGSHLPVRCDSGTYQDETEQGTCKECPTGYFCDNVKAPVVLYNSSICPEGYYCPNGTKYDNEYPCPTGTYSNYTGLQMESDCLLCPGGYYCDLQAQTDYSKICAAGYYCRQGAMTGTPSQGTDADECPAGHYCPIQTTEPVKCPKGTYSNMTKLIAESECVNCTAGYYCGQLALLDPEGFCQERYYCPESSDLATFLDCPMGAYCPTGSAIPTLCPNGTYSNVTNLKISSECTICPGGYYCETEGLISPTGLCGEGYYCPDGTIQKEPPLTYCPVGNYCPEGVSQPIPCRNQTENNHTHAVECYPCPAGFYCAISGQSEICPAGYYCPAGTGLDWKSCPRGTYSDVQGLYDESQCKPCPAGQFCDGEHLTTPSGDCSAGHWCMQGIDRDYPNGLNQSSLLNNTCYDDRELGYGGLCFHGHYCPVATSYPIVCDNGTYANVEGLSSCDQCPMGYYCPQGTANYTDYPCPTGHYCPASTKNWNQYPCNSGTFNNQTMRTASGDCLSCTGGYYCGQTGLSEPSGPCAAGYYCDGGATTDMPSGAGGNQCTAGYYCPEASAFAVACDPGYYCANDRLNETSGKCNPGYYCTSLATVANPTDGTTGNICPEGAYCPEGSTSPTLCQAGYYLNSTGNDDMTDCILCTPGMYYCGGSGNNVPDGLCSAGGTAQVVKIHLCQQDTIVL